jgi:Ulp1 family protease
MDGEWLNDKIINFYTHFLQEKLEYMEKQE